MKEWIGSTGRRRRGAILLLSAFLLVVMLAMVAFAVDIGFIVLVRTQLQAAADASVMAAGASTGLPRSDMVNIAKEYAGYHTAGGRKVQLLDEDVEYGTWDVDNRRFTPSAKPGNACARDGSERTPSEAANRRSFSVESSTRRRLSAGPRRWRWPIRATLRSSSTCQAR